MYLTLYYLLKLQEEDNVEKKNRSLLSSFDEQFVHKVDHGERKDSSSSLSLDKQCRCFSLAEIKRATHDFDDAFVIGKGGFGNVYKGAIDVEAGIDVAIKRLNIDSNQGEAEFWAEIEMLSKFRHSHIVSLLGYHEEPGEMILVYEYMANGSLKDHLHRRRANGSNSSSLTWIQRLHICIGAARGLDYLHTGTGVQCRVIHRHVKSSNILLDENLAAKISDFGVSRIGPAFQSGTTNVYTGHVTGTFGYMDAEYFSTHRLTRKSDVYAFGVVLLEVLCGRPALDFTLDERQHSLAGWAKHCIKKGRIGRIIDPCLRGQVSASCLNEFGQIAYECIRSCSKDRPTMTKVLTKFSHPRLVKLLGYCSEDGRLLLVHEYIPKINLAERLGYHPLQWGTAMKIAIGAAQGLAFLHTVENTPVYRTLNASNVLLNKDFEAELYFGLATLGSTPGRMTTLESDMLTSHLTTPEYMATGHWCFESDVYALGVLMLHMIVGSRFFMDNQWPPLQSLTESAKPILSDCTKLQESMDPWFENDNPPKRVEEAGELILSCLEIDPQNRPSMIQVVASLERIKSMNM